MLKDIDSSPTAQNDIFPGTRLRLGHSHRRGGFQTRPIVIGRKPSFQRFRTTGDDRKILVSTKILHFARRPFIFAGCRRCGLTIMAQHGKERLPSPTEEPLKAGPNGCRGRRAPTRQTYPPNALWSHETTLKPIPPPLGRRSDTPHQPDRALKLPNPSLGGGFRYRIDCISGTSEGGI